MPDDFEIFQEMKRRGQTPVECALAAKSAGLGLVPSIRMLREVHGLSLLDAKEALIVSEGWPSLDEYQASLFPALEIALVEEQLGFAMPDDLRAFFLGLNDRDPNLRFFLRDEKGFLVSYFLPMSNPEKTAKGDIVEAFKIWQAVGVSDALSRSIPIAADPCGNYLLYSLDELSLGAIYAVNQDAEPPDDIFYLCGSLAEFLAHLIPEP